MLSVHISNSKVLGYLRKKGHFWGFFGVFFFAFCFSVFVLGMEVVRANYIFGQTIRVSQVPSENEVISWQS